MTAFSLYHRDCEVLYSEKPAILQLKERGKILPWHIDLETNSQISVKIDSREESLPLRLSDLVFHRLSPTKVQWLGEIGGAGLSLGLEISDEGIGFSVSPTGTGKAVCVGVNWPGTISVRGTRREVCWSGGPGAVFRADGKPWQTKADWRYCDMPFGGFTCDGKSLALIIDTPFDAISNLSDNGQGNMSASIEFLPSMGELAYPRQMHLIPLAECGYVAVANAFRNYVQSKGLWMSWEERVALNPNVAKLKGAFVACAGYWQDNEADIVGAMRAMKTMGFDHGYLFSPRFLDFDPTWRESVGAQPNAMSDAQIQQIQDLGYLCAPFLEIELASPAMGQHMLATDATGNLIKGWQMGNIKFYEIAKWRIPAMLARFEDPIRACQAVHIDTLTSMIVSEHHGVRSYDRAGCAQHRVEVAQWARRLGKVVVAEGMKYWANRVCDFSTAKGFFPYKAWEDTRAWETPLGDLVYHDSIIRTQWEHWSYDDNRHLRNLELARWHPFAQELYDLLTAAPPVLFPEGRQFQFKEKINTRPDGSRELKVSKEVLLYNKRFKDAETQAALPKALRVCRLNERHGFARMVNHRFLEDNNALIQEAEFSTGLQVIVNFSDEPYTLQNGKTLGARSALLEGDIGSLPREIHAG